jgi:hypothetical protein
MTGSAHNPWGISFMAMMHMSNDSHLFADASGPGLLPLYEAKMIHQFDHRWATYGVNGEQRIVNGGDVDHSPLTTRHSPENRDVTPTEKADPHFTVTPRYWVSEAEVEQRLKDKNWSRGWLMGWRDICRATDERTVIAAVVPRVGINHKIPLFFALQAPSVSHSAALLTNFDSLVLDYVARQKVGGTSLTYFYLKQLPFLPPDHYTETDLAFIVPRVLELTYTAHDLAAWAADLVSEWRMGNGEWKANTPLATRHSPLATRHSLFAIRHSPLTPYPFDPERRAHLRAELDAYYARLYGLTRDELRYILDPADMMGDDYPSETFRVLKNNEMRAFGEYRTQRLVLAAWDRLKTGEIA